MLYQYIYSNKERRKKKKNTQYSPAPALQIPRVVTGHPMGKICMHSQAQGALEGSSELKRLALLPVFISCIRDM